MLLKYLPHEEAQSVLTGIRAGKDLKTIASRVRAGDLLLPMAVDTEAPAEIESLRYTIGRNEKLLEEIAATTRSDV